MTELVFYLLLETAPQSDSLSNSLLKPIVLVGFIVVAAFFMLVTTHRRIKQSRKHSAISARERIEMKSSEKDMYNSMGELMGELAELSRQINGQIDTRCKKLEILLRDADRTIDRLESLQNNSKPSGSESTLRNGHGSSTSFSSSDATETTETGTNIRPIQPTKGAPDVGIDDSAETREVLKLAEKGMDDRSIAKVLDRPLGEVQLILSLSKKNR